MDSLNKILSQAKAIASEGAVDFRSEYVNKQYCGLYRDYMNSYYCVYEVSVMPENMDALLFTFFSINNPVRRITMPRDDFFAETYTSTVISQNGERSLVTRPILFHPSNVTHQKTAFVRITNVDSLETDIPTDTLVEELCRRKDNPLTGLDVEGMMEDVVFIDYPIVHHGRDSRGEFMQVNEIYDNYKEALRNSYSFNGIKEAGAYKRTWIRLN